MKKYMVVITVDFEPGNFYINVSASDKEKARQYAINMFLNENPIYRGCERVYDVMEV